jgi:hypothetical protein
MTKTSKIFLSCYFPSLVCQKEIGGNSHTEFNHYIEIGRDWKNTCLKNPIPESFLLNPET